MGISKRETFINYVKDGGKKFCSPQIGAGAGFDTKLAGKKWISETTFDDTLNAVERFDIVPLINVGCAYESLLDIQWKLISTQQKDDKIWSEHIFETPVGNLSRTTIETIKEGLFMPEYPVTGENDLTVMEYYIDMLLDANFEEIVKLTQNSKDTINNKGAMSVQWAVQPYELLCLPNTVDTLLLHTDYPKRCKKMMDKIVKIDKKLFKKVAEGGADFIFLGAPAAEMLSPAIYEKMIVPYSQIVTKAAHDCGLMVYSHICSPIEPFLSMGFYNQMGIDLFETLSSPPVGNIKSLSDALSKIDTSICTRGNIGLDILLNGSIDDVKRKTLDVLEAAEGRKHIVAASDYLFYDIKEENVKAMADAVMEFNSDN